MLIEKISAGVIPDCDELEFAVIKNRALEIEIGAITEEAKAEKAIAFMNEQVLAASQKSLGEIEELFKKKLTTAQAQFFEASDRLMHEKMTHEDLED